ncbi:MAG TPA: ribosome small subunit-dependent GTPase A [Saprospiraceae bacterium]|nr:ribosome small subunit-dependent GTPase A [Saprospiraceae bacterium]
MQGIVQRSTGSWYEIREMNSQQIYSCRLVGKMKLDKHDLTNPIAVGDQILFTIDSNQIGIISEILPRRNYIIRQSPKNKHQLHLIAANIDQAILVTTIIEPQLKPGFIDRFLLSTEPQNIPVTIVFNKADIYGKDELEIFNIHKSIYEKIGYRVLLTSSIDKIGIKELQEQLKNKITLCSGQSGVGKSSLLNEMHEGRAQKTGEISGFSGKGTHTTTFAEMIPLINGGYIIDTPGIKLMSFNNLQLMDVSHNFRELFEASSFCRFGAQCLHRNEPDCEVKLRVSKGFISGIRYDNYLTLIEEIEAQNHWERKKRY